MPPLNNAPLNYELKFACPTALCHYASDLCEGIAGVHSVMRLFRDDEAGIERPYEVAVYSQDDTLIERVAWVLAGDELLKDSVDIGLLKQTPIREEDWAEAWKAFWDIDTIVKGKLTICPSWKTYDATSPDEVVLHLDPGSAFGTGAHETTRLMLEALHDFGDLNALPNQHVMDVGCGSGILALYVAKLGAKQVTGLDIDLQSVVVSKENAVKNQLDTVCTFTDTELSSLAQTPEYIGHVDVLLANILGPIIIKLLPDMLTCMTPHARFICSGLIDRSARDVEDVLIANGFHTIERRQLNRWIAISAIGPDKQ